MKNRIFMTVLMVAVCLSLSADGNDQQDVQETTVIRVLLPTKDSGPWPCVYYMLNSNEELDGIKPEKWAGRCISEEDWAWGDGPFSSQNDQFLKTRWGSDRLPILIRRHFTLSAEEISNISQSTITLTYSYDENPKVYLNGVLITSKIGFNDNNYATYTLTLRNKNILKEGDNVLAVSLNAGEGSGHIDYGLTMTSPYVPTGITQTNYIHDTTDMIIYDLQGCRVENPSPGVYITNGKKIIIK